MEKKNEIICPCCQKVGEVWINSRETSDREFIITIVHRRTDNTVSVCKYQIATLTDSIYEIESMYRDYIRRFRTQHNYADGHLYRAVKNLADWYWLYSEWFRLMRLLDALDGEYPRWITNRLQSIEQNLLI